MTFLMHKGTFTEHEKAKNGQVARIAEQFGFVKWNESIGITAELRLQEHLHQIPLLAVFAV